MMKEILLYKTIICYKSLNWATDFCRSVSKCSKARECWCFSMSSIVPSLPRGQTESLLWASPWGSRVLSWDIPFPGFICASWPRTSACRWGSLSSTFRVDLFPIWASDTFSWFACSTCWAWLPFLPAFSVIRSPFSVWSAKPPFF